MAKNTYLELINQAQKRLYICTPYLILDNDLLSCLRLAAKRGVDVRIYTPGVPDKPTIYQLTRSYFPHLLRAGVKIYSYTPGFLHAKTWLMDDRIAAVGTVNLDYRSLYLHFENSVLIYGGAVLEDVRRDLAEIERESAAVTLADCRTGFFRHDVQRRAAVGSAAVLRRDCYFGTARGTGRSFFCCGGSYRVGLQGEVLTPPCTTVRRWATAAVGAGHAWPGREANGIYRATTSGRRGTPPPYKYTGDGSWPRAFGRGGVTPPSIGALQSVFLVQSPPKHKTAIDNR